MSRFIGILSVLIVVILAMAFAAANVGHMATLNLGLFTLYRVPVTMVAFLGLVVGMLVMFATGVHSDLKVRRILRERLAEETRKEQVWIDRNQRDLFAQDPEANPGGGPAAASPLLGGGAPQAGARQGAAGDVGPGGAGAGGGGFSEETGTEEAPALGGTSGTDDFREETPALGGTGRGDDFQGELPALGGTLEKDDVPEEAPAPGNAADEELPGAFPPAGPTPPDAAFPFDVLEEPKTE